MKKLDWGTVFISKGKHKGRIGYYDDDEFICFDDDCETGEEQAIVYFGDLLLCSSYHYIPYNHLRYATIDDLMRRRSKLKNQLFKWSYNMDKVIKVEEFIELLWIEDDLYERLIKARYKEVEQGKKVFISHSSNDKQFARWLFTDLANVGHNPWIDDQQIKVGDSIPSKIQNGITSSDYIIVILSEHSIKSHWVEKEWQTKYWEEVKTGDIKVLPVLFQECQIPALLETKKYADFTNDYSSGLDDLLAALKE